MKMMFDQWKFRAGEWVELLLFAPCSQHVTANYYTLLALVNELRPQLVGARFQEAYSVRPNELRIVLDRGTLVILAQPINGGLFLSSRDEHKPKSNVFQFFQQLKGDELTDATIAQYDRSITLRFGEFDITIQLFGTPNALLLQAGQVIAAFKKHNTVIPETEANTSIQSLLGKRYLRELGDEPSMDAIALLDQKLRASQCPLLYRSDSDILLSLVPLTSVGDMKASQAHSVNDAVRVTLIDRAKLHRLAAIRKNILDKLKADLTKATKAERDMLKGAEHSSRSVKYQAIANALMMVGHEIPTGAKTTIVDIADEPVIVKLDETLNAYENAGKYFERAKHAEQSRKNLKQRGSETAERIVKLQAEISRIAEEQDIDRLIERQKSGKKKQDTTATIDGSFFREFTVAGGMKVLVGKNAKQNDELTLHVAKKDDVWLHARGVPGSHVVLQTGKRTVVPKEAIEQAAEIAAFYSDAKSQGLAPVAYTQKKYVRKPRGAALGAVKLEREEVVMVKPQIRGRTD